MGTAARITSDGAYLDYTPGSAVTAGDVIVLGELVTVADEDIAASALGAVSKRGIYRFPKTAATTYAVGVKVYWDVADQEITEDADGGTNKFAGYVALAAASADTTIDVLLAD